MAVLENKLQVRKSLKSCLFNYFAKVRRATIFFYVDCFSSSPFGFIVAFRNRSHFPSLNRQTNNSGNNKRFTSCFFLLNAPWLFLAVSYETKVDGLFFPFVFFFFQLKIYKSLFGWILCLVEWNSNLLSFFGSGLLFFISCRNRRRPRLL